MEDFANQLANLQRAAARAGGGGSNNYNGTTVNNGGSSNRGKDDGGNDGRRKKKRDNNYDEGGVVYNDKRRRGNNYTTSQRQNEGTSLRTLIDGVAERYNNDTIKIMNMDGAPPTKQTTRKPKKRRGHIALLFLTIDDLPHEHIWQEWLHPSSSCTTSTSSSDNNDKNSNEEEEDDGVIVSVIVHAKHPHRINSPWLKQRHLLQQRSKQTANASVEKNIDFHTRKPEWGSVDITKAMMDLLEEGLKIGTTTTTTTAARTMEDDGGSSKCCSYYRRYLSTTCQSKCHTSSSAVAVAVATTASHTKDDDDEDDDVIDKIPTVDRFIFVSESCLPVTTLKECELALFGPRHPSSSSHSDDNTNITTNIDDLSLSSLYDKSWIHARSTPNNGYAKQLQWDAILKRKRDDDTIPIPSQYIWKSDQWVILTRKHALAITTLPRAYLNDISLLDTVFTNVRASDEIYIPTVLSIVGIIHRPMGVREVEDYNYDTITMTSGQKCKRRRITKEEESRIGYEIRRRRSTYCDWSMGAKNPVSFSTVDEWNDVVCKAREEGCLFARKFVTTTTTTPNTGRGKTGGGGVSQSMLCKEDGGLITVEAWKAAIYNFDKNAGSHSMRQNQQWESI